MLIVRTVFHKALAQLTSTLLYNSQAQFGSSHEPGTIRSKQFGYSHLFWKIEDFSGTDTGCSMPLGLSAGLWSLAHIYLANKCSQCLLVVMLIKNVLVLPTYPKGGKQLKAPAHSHCDLSYF